MRLAGLKEELLQAPEVGREGQALDPEFQLIRALVKARNRAGLSQAGLAERMATTQPTIARLESGRRAPSWQTLKRLAEATGTRYPRQNGGHSIPAGEAINWARPSPL